MIAIKAVLVLAAIAAVVAAVIGGIWLIYRGSTKLTARRAKRSAHRYTADMAMQRARARTEAELIARCDEQNQQVLAGDEHGVTASATPNARSTRRRAACPEREAQRAEFDAEAEARRER